MEQGQEGSFHSRRYRIPPTTLPTQVALFEAFSNLILNKTSPDLILRSGVFAASRRMAASPRVASILRDASLRDAPQDEVFAKNSRRRACFEAVSCLILNKTSPDLILRSGVFAASRRMAASPYVASILRDASLRDAPQDE